jgi:sterol desaturase/sphingolipid hydroxylase (fatty acid hydroxylase superfamily)
VLPLPPLVHHLLSSTLTLLAFAAIGALLQVAWPARRDQRFFRPGFVADLLHSFVNPLLAAPLVGALLLFSGARGAHPVGLGALPTPLQAVVAIVVVDLVGYWRHRFLHTRAGWACHAVHHSSRELDWLSNERVEIGEMVTTNFCQAAALALCGFPPEILAFNLFARRAWGFFVHMNVDLPFGPLRYVLVTPVFHRWHHSTDPRAANRNFATFFSAIDWIFGTWFLPAGELPAELGPGTDPVPAGYVEQVAYPWLTWVRRLVPRGSGPASAPPAG